MENTKYQIATGGTPITTWIPNQIEAVLNYMWIILEKIDDLEFVEYKKPDLTSRCRILVKQAEELKKVDYNINLVYELEDKYKEY